MESSVFLSDLLTAHEPLSIVSFISNELCVRFMGSEHLEKLDVSWGHEPGRGLQSGTGFQPVSPEQASCLCHFLRSWKASFPFCADQTGVKWNNCAPCSGRSR